ncbi:MULTISPECIES: 30S ribosome-binding factor RbfA [Capnocytophaga]|jgi:ribosome-binding factor A|uniref:30S ribosome-binding factor RbfA n=1 Tax=Capnocytophaga sp. oral taxon 332 TaxID=712213 RepID=UPI0002A3EE46|nr:30S ribosome-binding factor RbfA [Capnocytophaga sp. oral taxon 332]EKY09704.1 ribosome-binding factor A [Capnocytophaga sp. oral taxon 332 str. F0381]
MENNRQKKIAGIIQEELAKVLQQAIRDAGQNNLIISVTKVNVAVDLSTAKVYVSVFPETQAAETLKGLSSNAPLIKHELSQITKNQFRRMPELFFYIDDSLQYIEGIEQSLKEEENPIENRTLLYKRKMT